MQTDYYQSQNYQNSPYLNQTQRLNSNNNTLNNSFQSYQNIQINQRTHRFSNNYSNINNNNNNNNHLRGLTQEIENRNLNNNNLNYNPYSTNSNWQKLKDQILSPGDNENYANNIYYQKNNNMNYNDYQELNSYNNYNNNNNLNKYNRSSSSQRLHYNTINTNLNLTSNILPKETKNNKKTLILDLDETLVHSAFKPFFIKSDINLNVNVDGINHLVHVLKRPFVDEFLQRMSKFYEIVIFTASISNYANPLLDKLDKFNLISYRLFREHCVSNRGLYIKDLSKLGRNLKDMIIIDNNPVSYAENEENGIPILTWHYDKNDNELIRLIPILEFLSNVNDVRDYIKRFVDKSKNEVDFGVVENILRNESNNNQNSNFNNPLNNINNNKDSNENDIRRNSIINDTKRYNENVSYDNSNNLSRNLNYDTNINNNLTIPKDINNNNNSMRYSPYTENYMSNVINNNGRNNNNLNNNYSLNNNNEQTYRPQLAYTPKANYRITDNDNNISNNSTNNNESYYNERQNQNYASYTGTYLNRRREQIRNELDDISNNNYNEKQELNIRNNYQIRSTPNININIVNQNFSIDNQSNNNINNNLSDSLQERTKKTIYYNQRERDDNINNNIKNYHSNNSNNIYPNNLIYKNYNQYNIRNLNNNNRNDISGRLLYDYNNKQSANYTSYNITPKINNYISNYQNIRPNYTQLYKNLNNENNNKNNNEGLKNFQSRYNSIFNRNEYKLDNDSDNNKIFNRSASGFYPRNSINLEQEETEENNNNDEIFTQSISNYNIQTPQRNFDRTLLLTPNRRYNNEDNNNIMNNSRSVEREKKIDLSLSSPYMQERENNLEYENHYDDYRRNLRPYQYGNISNYSNYDNNNNLHNYNYYSLLRNYATRFNNENNNNNIMINTNNNRNNNDFINSYRNYLNRPLTSYTSNNFYTRRNSNDYYDNLREQRRFYNY